MTRDSVRGAGQSRAGATDTTMLIWKVIAANPGITRQGIWEQVEHSIPEGYALRMYARHGVKQPWTTVTPLIQEAARRYVLTHILKSLRRRVVTWEGDGADRRYTIAAEIAYHGDAEMIDVDGTKAAKHMAEAEALRTAEKYLTRGDLNRTLGRSGKRGPVVGPPSRKEYEALQIIVKAQRAKRPA